MLSCDALMSHVQVGTDHPPEAMVQANPFNPLLINVCQMQGQSCTMSFHS